MNELARLTRRESEMASYLAWGATKKDIANKLHISARTVENTCRKIFDKTGVTKVNELSAWWFCVNFNISMELSPLNNFVLSYLIPMIYIFQVEFKGLIILV